MKLPDKLVESLLDAAFNNLQHDTGPQDKEYVFLRDVLGQQFKQILRKRTEKKCHGGQKASLAIPESTKAQSSAADNPSPVSTAEQENEHLNSVSGFQASSAASPDAQTPRTDDPKQVERIKRLWVRLDEQDALIDKLEREIADLRHQVLLDTGNIERMQQAGAQNEATITDLRLQLEKRVAEEQKAYEQRVAAAHRNIDILQRTQNERNEQKGRAEQAERELAEANEQFNLGWNTLITGGINPCGSSDQFSRGYQSANYMRQAETTEADARELWEALDREYTNWHGTIHVVVEKHRAKYSK